MVFLLYLQASSKLGLGGIKKIPNFKEVRDLLEVSSGFEPL
jgi:hypothetical protein